MRRTRTAAALLLLCLFALFPAASYAAGMTTCELEELGLSVDVPDPFFVFTRDTPADDPGYAEYGISKADMDSILEEKDIYLNALSSELNCEIVVTKTGSILDDFSTWSDVALLTMADSMKGVYSEAGATYIKSEIYHHPQAKFIKIYISQRSGDIEQYSVQYYTVYNSQAINITLHSYTGMLGEEAESMIQGVVDSADFWDAEPMGALTEPFEYVHPETGLRFTVPAGWQEKPLSKEREHLVAKFLPTEEDGDSILFGCSDYWPELPAADRLGHTRAELDNSLLTELWKELPEEEFAALFCGDGSQVEKISTVSYGGREYIKVVVQEAMSVYGMEISITVTNLLRVENGYLYTFQFSGTDTSWHYPDFEALLNSVNYPAADVSASSSPDSSSAVVVGGGALMAVLLFALKFMQGPKKKEEETNERISHRSTLPITSVREKPPEVKQGSEPGRFCRRCGKPLSEDSCYCPYCGEKWEEGEKTP